MSRTEGISSLLIIFLVVMLLIVLTLIYGVTTKSSLPLVGTLGLSSKCNYSDGDLCKFLNRIKLGDYVNKNLEIVATLTDPTGDQIKYIWQQQKTNTRYAQYQDGIEIFHTISYGNATYTKDAKDGRWWQQPRQQLALPPTAGFNSFSVETYRKQSAQFDNNLDYKKKGKEKCGEYLCFKYQLTDPNVVDYTAHLYFDDKDYLLRRQVITHADGSIADMTYEYKHIDIIEPTSTKPLKPGQRIIIPPPRKENLDYIKEFQSEFGDPAPSIQP